MNINRFEIDALIENGLIEKIDGCRYKVKIGFEISDLKSFALLKGEIIEVTEKRFVIYNSQKEYLVFSDRIGFKIPANDLFVVFNTLGEHYRDKLLKEGLIKLVGDEGFVATKNIHFTNEYGERLFVETGDIIDFGVANLYLLNHENRFYQSIKHLGLKWIS